MAASLLACRLLQPLLPKLLLPLLLRHGQVLVAIHAAAATRAAAAAAALCDHGDDLVRHQRHYVTHSRQEGGDGEAPDEGQVAQRVRQQVAKPRRQHDCKEAWMETNSSRSKPGVKSSALACFCSVLYERIRLQLPLLLHRTRGHINHHHQRHGCCA
jgi:hypothetical protein